MPCRTGSSIFFLTNNRTTYILKGVGEKKKKGKIIGNTKGRYLRIELFFADDMLRLILSLYLPFQMSLGSLRAL